MKIRSNLFAKHFPSENDYNTNICGLLNILMCKIQGRSWLKLYFYQGTIKASYDCIAKENEFNNIIRYNKYSMI